MWKIFMSAWSAVFVACAVSIAIAEALDVGFVRRGVDTDGRFLTLFLQVLMLVEVILLRF